MFGKTETMNAVCDLLCRIQLKLEDIEEEMRELRKERSDLLDRIMADNYGDYVMGRMSNPTLNKNPEVRTPANRPEPQPSDDDLAGEFIRESEASDRAKH